MIPYKIDRATLRSDLMQAYLDAHRHKRSRRYRKELWGEVVDMDFVSYLTREIVLLDCTADCHIKGRMTNWNGLPDSKSLFCSPKGKGLPKGYIFRMIKLCCNSKH